MKKVIRIFKENENVEEMILVDEEEGVSSHQFIECILIVCCNIENISWSLMPATSCNAFIDHKLSCNPFTF